MTSSSSQQSSELIWLKSLEVFEWTNSPVTPFPSFSPLTDSSNLSHEDQLCIKPDSSCTAIGDHSNPSIAPCLTSSTICSMHLSASAPELLQLCFPNCCSNEDGPHKCHADLDSCDEFDDDASQSGREDTSPLSGEECAICLTSEPDAILQPCGHKLCWTCAEVLVNDKKFKAHGKCWLCRVQIEKVTHERDKDRFIERDQTTLTTPLTTRRATMAHISGRVALLREIDQQRRLCYTARMPEYCCVCGSCIASPEIPKFRLFCRPPLSKQVQWLMRRVPCGHGICSICCETVFGTPIASESLNVSTNASCITNNYPRRRHITSCGFKCPHCRWIVVDVQNIPEELARRVAEGRARVDRYGLYQ